MVVQPQGCVPALYRSRRPADTALYRAVQNHLETFLALCPDDWEEESVSPHAERELRRFLECGILTYGNVVIQVFLEKGVVGLHTGDVQPPGQPHPHM